MDEPARTFLFDLLDTPSPTGWETRGQQKWINYNRQFTDQVEHDSYGNAWATLSGAPDGPVIMLEAHADEIGYIVKHVTSEGFLSVDRVGGSDHATARGRRVRILTEGGEVHGVIGNTAIHIRDRRNGEKAPEIHQLYVDVGASSAEEVEAMGIRVGYPMVYADAAEEFGKDRIMGRALDNRIGGYIIAEVMRRLAEDRPACTVHAANCIHEEIGGLGAKMVAHRLQPDVCVVLDVTHATDTPGIKHEQHGRVTLGGGPSLTHGAANHTEVVKRLIRVAEEADLPLQHESASRFTGTDTDQIYHVRDGIPSALVSLPLRYMHSVVEVADMRDIARVIDLLSRFARSVSTGDTFGVSLE